MHDPKLPPGFFASIPVRVFNLTGFRLGALLKYGAVLLVAVIGIASAIFYTEAEVERNSSNSSIVKSQELTDQEKLHTVSQLPEYFSEMLPVEQLGILKSKIEIGEVLAKSDGEFADKATEQLVSLYGIRCSLEESEGIDSNQTYRRMAGLRQEAIAAGNKERAATLDFLRALAATNRLNRRAEKSDFRFAADAILNLDSSNLVKVNEARKLFVYVLNLLETLPDTDSTKLLISVASDKLSESPELEVSNLGRGLADYTNYSRYYRASKEFPSTSREERLKLYKDLFEVVEDSPPQSAATYKIIVQLLDRLVNRSEVDIARTLIDRLSKVASTVDPKIKIRVDRSLANIRMRTSVLGKKVTLSGSSYDGSPLQLSNGKPTTLLFWRPTDVESAKHIELLASSGRFDQWNSNVLFASQSKLTEKGLNFLVNSLSSFTVLDNETAKRLAEDFAIDLMPYEVSLDKDGTVVRLGASNN